MSGVIRDPWKTIQSYKKTFEFGERSTSSVPIDTFILKESEDLVSEDEQQVPFHSL
jgi:hypothetical protein